VGKCAILELRAITILASIGAIPQPVNNMDPSKSSDSFNFRHFETGENMSSSKSLENMGHP
jgi:hypothetical protein